MASSDSDAERAALVAAAHDTAGGAAEGPRALPAGTVTFLFTDLEGSTRLLGAHPVAYREAVRRHHDLLLGAVEARSGVVFETVGDAVYAAFARPADAVAAALNGQRALQREDWRALGLGTAVLRARMGLHTGEVEVQGAHYFGAPLYRCARLMATAHGGQVVLSAATAELVHDELPEGSLRDLGEHRLKDLARPQRIFQLTHADLPAEFPPLASLNLRPHNLPVQPTPFIGRGGEIAAIRRRLAEPTLRLLTLTGPAGVGKTRLALQAAAEALDDFPGGVFFVPLEALRRPELVVPAIAKALGVREAGGLPLEQLVADYLRDRRVLLLLDNFEQVLDAGPAVAGLLAACPRLTALVTSRAVLRLTGEGAYPIPPLALPGLEGRWPIEQLAQVEAVALFVQQARAAVPDFVLTEANAPAVAAVCRQLDGLPLALELAAARVRVLSPRAIDARLADRLLPVLAEGPRDAPERHQTLRGAIDWSYDLLRAGEQTLFRRLAVFAGGCTLEAAAAVCAPSDSPAAPDPPDPLDGLAALVEQSLLRFESGPDGADRYRLLEPVREYAALRLETSGEAAALRRRHAAHFLQLAEQAAPALGGPAQGQWLARLETEHDNLRAALREVCGGPDAGDAGPGLRLATALWRFWMVHSHFSEGREWTERVLGAAGAASVALRRKRAEAVIGAGALAWQVGDYSGAGARFEEGLALSRELDDERGVATALNSLGNLAWAQARYDEAQGRYEESLALHRALSDEAGVARSLNNLGTVASDRGNLASERGDESDAERHYAQAWQRHEESLALRRELGDRRSIAQSTHNLGEVALRRGDDARARALLQESLVMHRDLGSKEFIAGGLGALARLAARLDQPERAARLFGATAAIRQATGIPPAQTDRFTYERSLAAVRDALGEPSFAAASAAGRALPTEAAIAEALALGSQPEPGPDGRPGAEAPAAEPARTG